MPWKSIDAACGVIGVVGVVVIPAACAPRGGRASGDSPIRHRRTPGSHCPSSEYRRGIPTELLDAARQALARHDWQAAYDDTLAALAATSGEAGDSERATLLDTKAEAAWWLGRLDDCIEAREAAFAIFDECGQTRQAAQCAVCLYEHYNFRARPTIGGAWLRRA